MYHWNPFTQQKKSFFHATILCFPELKRNTIYIAICMVHRKKKIMFSWRNHQFKRDHPFKVCRLRAQSLRPCQHTVWRSRHAFGGGLGCRNKRLPYLPEEPALTRRISLSCIQGIDWHLNHREIVHLYLTRRAALGGVFFFVAQSWWHFILFFSMSIDKTSRKKMTENSFPRFEF